MISIDPNKARFLNKRSSELVALIKEIEYSSIKRQQTSKSHNSIEDKIALKIPESIQIIEPYREYEESGLTDKIVSAFEIHKRKKYGFTESNFLEVEKLVDNILKEKSINALISREFIVNKTLDWIFSVYRNKQIYEEYTDFVVSESTQAINVYKFLFPVLKLEISEKYQLGKSTLFFMSKSYIEELEGDYLNNEKDYDEDYFKMLRDTYQGQVFISTTVNAEKEKAKEIAFDECTLSIDILKITSITLNAPEYKLLFDIDRNARGNHKNNYLIQDIKKPYYFTINHSINQKFYTLDKKVWENSILNQLSIFHNFLLNRTKDESELSSLITLSISRFSDALSKDDLNQRIVDLFTILESLLLNNEESNIVENISKYCSKLVSKKTDERKEIMTLIKKMYKIRSSLIHHGKYKIFEIEDLRKLQAVVIALLINLIGKINTHNSKHSILKEIDDAIMNAY